MMSLERITIPNLTATELIIEAMRKLELTCLDEDIYMRQDFLGDDGGKTFEVLTWKPGRCVTSDEVRRYFAGLGADGNTAAFVAWVTENNPVGCHASIPSDSTRLLRIPFTGILCAPVYDRDDEFRGLDRHGAHLDWEDDFQYIFVAFREVKRP